MSCVLSHPRVRLRIRESYAKYLCIHILLCVYLIECSCSSLNPQPEYDCGCLDNVCHVVIAALYPPPTTSTRRLLLDNLPSIYALVLTKSSCPSFPL